MKSLIPLFLVWLLGLFPTYLKGQFFEKHFGNPSYYEEGFAIINTPYDGLAVAGIAESSSGDRDFLLLRLDTEGVLLGSFTYGTPDVSEGATDIILLDDGGFLLIGLSEELGNFDEQITVVRTDANGNELWLKKFGGTGFERAFSITKTPNGTFLIVGVVDDDEHPTGDLLVLEIDLDGNLLQSLTYGSSNYDWGYSIKNTLDGGYIIAGLTNSTSPSESSAYLLKLDNQLQEEWSQVFGTEGSNIAYDVSQTPEGDFLLVGSGLISGGFGGLDGFLIKTDNAGNLLWRKVVGDEKNDVLESVILFNSEIITIGSIGTDDEVNSTILLVAFDTDGNEIWRRSIGPETQQNIGRDITITTLGNHLAFTGLSEIKNEPGDVFVARTNTTGKAPNNLISGTLFSDRNQNCQFDEESLPLAGWIVSAIDGNQIHYTITDSLGQYELLVDTGVYQLLTTSLNDYWETDACPPQTVMIQGNFSEQTVDIPVNPKVNCPYLYARVSTPFLRRCFDNIYQIEYGNTGTLAAPNSQIILSLDEYLLLNDASMPFTVSNGQYIFETGALAIGQVGKITLNTTLSCEATLGETHCVEAKIFPDTLCNTPTENWDGASLKVTGTCEAEELTFVIKNIGEDMDNASSFVVIEDFVILFREPTPFQLDAGDSLVLNYPANGSTYRIELQQAEGHPARTKIFSKTIEGCGINEFGLFSTGIYTQFLVDDRDEFSAIDCQENIGSWDPNDKRAYPTGLAEEHCVQKADRLDYHIRFQNTGTDTAFTVIIRDTFSTHLDIQSVRAEVASHPFVFDIISDTVLKFTFNNILLPDSTTNEAASHGYVRFSMLPKTTVTEGAVFLNQAAIYFDFNEPVITNSTFHTIGDCLRLLESTDVTEISERQVLKVYPNPATNQITFEINTSDIHQMELIDLMGKKIGQYSIHPNENVTLNRQDIPPGVYWYRFFGKKGQIKGSGKIVFL